MSRFWNSPHVPARSVLCEQQDVLS